MSKPFTARVLATAAPVLFVLAACAPADAPPPPPTRSIASAEAATRSGDTARLLNDLGKAGNLATRAADLAKRLDPPAWLIALGAPDREHDLKLALKAMQAGDDDLLREAIGFGPQALMADVLSGGDSIRTRRANGRNYFETGPQPLDLLSETVVPPLPEGYLAMHATLRGRLDGHAYRLCYGFDAAGLIDLQAMPELARESIDIAPRLTRHATPPKALPAAVGMLDVSGLEAERWYSADFTLLGTDGAIAQIKLARDDRGWALLESSTETKAERLGALRDKRLQFLGRRATDFLRSSGRWPRGLNEISWQPLDLCDPTVGARPGWGDYADDPPAGLEIAPDADSGYSARCTQSTRAVTRDGEMLWLKP